MNLQSALATVALAVVVACGDGGPVTGPPSGLDVPPAVAEAYRVDAARLAARLVLDEGGAAGERIELPEPLIERIYNALLWVYASDHPARDIVVEVREIHTFPRPTLRETLVALDTTRAWARRLWRGEVPTGNAGADSLIERYGLRVKESYDWSIGPHVLLRSAELLNIPALGNRLASLDGVVRAEPNSWIGGGGDIDARETSGRWRLDYLYRWGDCPSGCIHEHRWSFRVDGGGVEYLGSTGESPPEP